MTKSKLHRSWTVILSMIPNTFFAFVFRNRKEQRRWSSSFARVRLHTVPPLVKLALLSDLYLNKPRNSLLSWDLSCGGVADGGSCRTITDIPEQWSNLHGYNNTNCIMRNLQWKIQHLSRVLKELLSSNSGGVAFTNSSEKVIGLNSSWTDSF